MDTLPVGLKLTTQSSSRKRPFGPCLMKDPKTLRPKQFPKSQNHQSRRLVTATQVVVIVQAVFHRMLMMNRSAAMKQSLNEVLLRFLKTFRHLASGWPLHLRASFHVYRSCRRRRRRWKGWESTPGPWSSAPMLARSAEIGTRSPAR